MEDHMRRKEDLETALRLQALEMRMSALETNLTKNTTATESLLSAWNTSQSTVGFIKGCAIFASACLGAWAAITKLWGH